MTTPHRTLREAAQMALDALLTGYHQGTQDAIAALREALAPDHLRDVAEKVAPAAPVVPLTEGRITAIANELAFGGGHCNVYELARAIEAAHGITGGSK